MTSPLEESITHLMEAYTRQGRILEQQREILEQLVTAQRETSRVAEAAQRAPVQEPSEPHEFERAERVDTPEQLAVIAHYHQMGSQLGRRAIQFAVLVRRINKDTLSVTGAPTQTARSIKVDTLSTPVSAWKRDHDVLTRSSDDFIGILPGMPVRLYAGPYLVGVGYWQDDISQARKGK
jgi:hypothetical protein